MERTATFEPLGDLLSDGQFHPFKPGLYYFESLRLLSAQSKDCTTVEHPATRYHVLSVNYDGHPNWWRRLLRQPEVVGIEIYDIQVYTKELGFSTETPFPLTALVEKMSRDLRLEFIWGALEKWRVLRYLKRQGFMVDLPRLVADS